MATDKISLPYTIEFAGELIVQDGNWLKCYEKNVMIAIPSLLEAIRTPRPLGEKVEVGIQMTGNEMCHMWRDEHFTHIGCLKDKTTDFNKKYVQFVKHLKQDKDGTNKS